MHMDRCRCGNIDADGQMQMWMEGCKFGCGQMDADVNGWMHNEGHGFGCIQVNVDGWIQIWMGGWMVAYMGQKLQDGKKVLKMSQLHPHSESCPGQTMSPINFSF